MAITRRELIISTNVSGMKGRSVQDLSIDVLIVGVVFSLPLVISLVRKNQRFFVQILKC